ncbi:MAG TPA: hypothetical protein PLA90_15220 [Candidatus Sumerlaeota bacterium]|nr:hypothetical protein [Candidatus Sumerlaeota bacterium]
MKFCSILMVLLWVCNSTSHADEKAVPTKGTPTPPERVEYLLSILAKPEPNFTPEEMKDHKKVQQAYSIYREEQLNASRELSRMGDSVVEILVEQIKKGKDGDFRDRLETILSRINTQKAREVRKNLNRGRLDSKSGYVVNEGLIGIKDIELDADLLTKVTACLKNPYRMQDALDVLAADPSSDFSTEKVQAITQSMLAQVGKPGMKFGYRNFEGAGIGSVADSIYRKHVWTLSRMKSVDETIRNEIGVQPEGIVRDLLKIALALRGDMKSERESLKTFLKNPEYRTLANNRLFCVEAFNKFGDKTDLPFLKELANSDPYSVEEYDFFPKCEKWGEEYINRTKDQIEYEKDAFAPKQTMCPEKQIPTKVTYPIREAAKGAIRAIEARTGGDGKSTAPRPESAERRK